MEYRSETDLLGSRELPATSLWGIHTLRALENFPLSGEKVHPELIKAYGAVKLACLRVNQQLGCFPDPQKAAALEQACLEMSEGLLNDQILVDALQGGAGTSTNMNVNEVLANRALQIMGKKTGVYSVISPLDDVNLHQSTNDTYPTALKLAAIRMLHQLELQIVALQEAFQKKEKEFAHIVKVGRTQLQDAVLTTLGREMAAYAEAFNRDRWRIYKCEERLRVVNLGGTAIGSGLGAPRQFIFRATDMLREITGIGLARAENLTEATMNNDVFVEVSGILKACASNMIKVSNDLRLMASGPEAGLGEINLPARQAGSSIMPGKINPVIPEAVALAALKVTGNDAVITQAVSAGNLELNQFMPLIAHCLLDTIGLLTSAAHIFNTRCVDGITANEDACKQQISVSTASVTALVPALGYEKASEAALFMKEKQVSLAEAVSALKLMNPEDLDALLSPEAVCKLGN